MMTYFLYVSLSLPPFLSFFSLFLFFFWRKRGPGVRVPLDPAAYCFDTTTDKIYLNQIDILITNKPILSCSMLTNLILMYSIWVALIRTLDEGSFTFLLVGIQISYREFYPTKLTRFWSKLAFCLQMFS